MGLAASRNRGAREAMQRMIVFLDDDIVAEPGFLAEHAGRHRESPDEHIALGYCPPVVGRERLWELALRSWWEDHFRRKAEPDPPVDLWTSSTATPRCPLRSCSRPAATAEGFRGRRQDWEFGIRLLSQGVRLAYYPDAKGWHKLDMSFETALRHSRQEGRDDVLLASRHPPAEESTAARRRERIRLGHAAVGATRLSAARSLRAPGAIRAGAPRPARGGSASWPLAPAGPRPAVVLVRARCDGRARLAAGVRGFLLFGWRAGVRRELARIAGRCRRSRDSGRRGCPRARARLRPADGWLTSVMWTPVGRDWAALTERVVPRGRGAGHAARAPRPCARIRTPGRCGHSASAATEPASQSRDEPPPSSRS